MACGQGEVAVRDYWRTAPRKKPKPKGAYWTCHHGAHTCGVKHSNQRVALGYSRKLNAAERRKGRRASWAPEKVSR